MTEQGERYDRMASGYEQHWAPVLAPSALGLLDRLDPLISTGADRLLDVGAGTGNLSIGALARWPAVTITGIDPSREMLAVAADLARERVPGAEDRFSTRVAAAAELPFEDASFDAAMSSFVLQLVVRRGPALREIRRVLRPGGRFFFVSWVANRSAFEPDRIFDALLDEFGFDEEDDPPRSGDFASVERAAAELRRAGFRDVRAEGALLDHAFGVDGYIRFLTDFDEESLFDDMGRSERRRFLARLRERLMALPPDALHFRAPIVYATGIRPER